MMGSIRVKSNTLAPGNRGSLSPREGDATHHRAADDQGGSSGVSRGRDDEGNRGQRQQGRQWAARHEVRGPRRSDPPKQLKEPEQQVQSGHQPTGRFPRMTPVKR
ncbi:hypothetical protein AAFF_G00147990 [Aldrovandia affinis]|uniref:Uncharacterized protein n=1 Tax=Aldrovandia affinis TaxID=143900 RepID=A0AAD7RPY1_9TELE|nr:hypothetical protein AAFF_G00147990 [Aldrovandia affinis]